MTNIEREQLEEFAKTYRRQTPKNEPIMENGVAVDLLSGINRQIREQEANNFQP